MRKPASPELAHKIYFKFSGFNEHGILSGRGAADFRNFLCRKYYII
jgi:hypothetical protein